jgi:hypothetical protein
MRKINTLLVALCAILVAVSCKDDTATPSYTLHVNKTTLNLSHEAQTSAGADNVFTVETDAPDGWKAAIYSDEAATTPLTASWLSLSASEGIDGASVYLIADELTEHVARKAWILVSAGDKTETIAVTQNAGPFMELDGFLDAEDGAMTVEATVTANVAWTATAEDADGLLESFSPESSDGDVNGTKFTYIFKNGANGEVTFVFKAQPDIEKAVTVNVQSGQPSGTWAKSHIVMTEDGRLIFNDYSKDTERNSIPANVQGLMFQWGSLVGIEMMGEDGYPWGESESKVVFTPEGYTLPSTAYADIPYYDDMTLAAGGTIDNFAGWRYDESKAIGDICRYISDKGWVAGKWRMPTQKEANDTELATPPPPVQNTQMGKAKRVPAVSTDWDGIPITEHYGWQQIPQYYLIGAGVTETSTFEDAGPDVLCLPAGGQLQLNTGMNYRPGLAGKAWTTSVFNAANGYVYGWQWTNAIITSLSGGARTFGNSVRCIAE